MKTSRFIIVLMLLSSIMVFTAGCGPVWTVSSTKYAVSGELYDSLDINKVVSMAVDNNKFIIVGVRIDNKGVFSGNIEDDLVFTLDDASVPFSYPNFYEDNAVYNFYNDVRRVYAGGQFDNGSIFFNVPYETNIDNCTFKAMTKDYTIIFSQALSNLTEVSDYPADW